MKQNFPIWLFVWDAQHEFYTHTRLSPGYNFDTKQPLNPVLKNYFGTFLKIYKHQNADSSFEMDASQYTLFDWDTNELAASKRFSEIQVPRIVLAVHANDNSHEVVRLRILIETLPEPKKDLEAWLREVQPTAETQSESVTITGGTFINSPILSDDTSIHSKIRDVQLGSPAPAILQAISQLRSHITNDTTLQPFEQRSALRDIDELAETVSSDKPKAGAVEHYLERLKAIADKSATLVKPIVDITRMLTGG